ncbi:MAG: nicotinamide riboside transporter PnuC [Nanoarchaeota archaeon]|nr:nicotinamide riboside transporter PnuC [Nanoarchaeota archaeon]
MKEQDIRPKSRIASAISNYAKDWNLFEKIWLLTFTAVNIYLFFAWHDSWIGLTASLTGMLCVVLTAKAKISSFYFGLINILAYSYVAYQSKYYGDVMLNILYFLPMTFVGIYFWRKNLKNNKKGEVAVRSLDWRRRFIWFGSSIVILTIYGLILTIIKGTLPFIDSATTVFSVIATIMLNKRLTEQWFFWIMVDVLSIIMWVYIFVTTGGDVSILVMWSAFLVNAVYGYYNWRKLEKR